MWINAFIHTLRFGNKFRDAVGGTSYLSFTNTRSPAGSKMSIPMMHKTDSGLRPYYLTHEFTIHDAPFDDEIVIAIGGASSGRAHACALPLEAPPIAITISSSKGASCIVNSCVR